MEMGEICEKLEGTGECSNCDGTGKVGDGLFG